MRRLASLRLSLTLAARALRAWTPRQVGAALVGSVVVGVVIGAATVLIPNPVFSREIAPVPWNYPVWIIGSVLTGMLVATYVRPAGTGVGRGAEGGTRTAAGTGVDAGARRTSRLGVAGATLAWYAVGCPVCNKIALLALGYSGALTWFAPAQPFLAVAAILLSGAALAWRLRGQVACPVPLPAKVVAP